MLELLKIPKTDPDVPVPDHGGTPLHGMCNLIAPNKLAAGFAQSGEGTALLIARGADPNIQNHLGLTARQEARGEAMTVYSITEKSARPLTELIKKYPRVAIVSTVAGAGLHAAFRDPMITSSMPSSTSVFKNPVVAAVASTIASGGSILYPHSEDHQEPPLHSEGSYLPVEGQDMINPFPEDRNWNGDANPSVQSPIALETEEEELDTPTPLGHIYVEKGERSLAFFVRCTTRKHTNSQFQMLVDEMHNMALNWPFIECEMFFLDPGGRFGCCQIPTHPASPG